MMIIAIHMKRTSHLFHMKPDSDVYALHVDISSRNSCSKYPSLLGKVTSMYWHHLGNEFNQVALPTTKPHLEVTDAISRRDDPPRPPPDPLSVPYSQPDAQPSQAAKQQQEGSCFPESRCQEFCVCTT